MKAMVLRKLCSLSENAKPLELMELPVPVPGPDEILVKITCCGVCHTELDEIEGRTSPPRLPIIPGHQVIGRVEGFGGEVEGLTLGDRVGVAWLFSACSQCKFCLQGNENLCPEFRATGRDANGGYAQYMTVSSRYAYAIPGLLSDEETAPLLCAGAIGYRSLRLTRLQDGQRLGLTGFGASAHLVLKMVKHKFPAVDVYVFARSEKERKFAMELGAKWVGDTRDRAPHKLDCIIDTTPVWQSVIRAMENLEPGGRLVINAIRKEDDKHHLLELDYAEHLWQEKEIKSVANITQADVTAFLLLAAEINLKPDVEIFPLEAANLALAQLKQGDIRGAKVLKIA